MKHFKFSEFNCKCCNLNHMNSFFLARLDIARDIAQVPFIINSGFRCAKHNEKVDGNEFSAHLTGDAADPKTLNSTQRFAIMSALLQVGFKRIGIGKDFVHVDDDENKGQYVMWLC